MTNIPVIHEIPDELLTTMLVEAWDKGYEAGRSNAMRYMSQEFTNVLPTPNPYRVRADAD